MLKKSLINKKVIFTAIGISVLLITGNMLLPSFTSAAVGDSYVFEFPDYSWGKTIVAWESSHLYAKGWRSWNELSAALPESGIYDVFVYFYANSGTSQLHEEFKILIDGEYLGEVQDPNSGSGYDKQYIGELDLAAGAHIVRAEHRWNFSDWGNAESVSPIKVFFVLKSTAKENLSISKTVNRNSAYAGDEIVYTITYRNDGAKTAENVVIRDNYDDSLLKVEEAGGGVLSGGLIEWQIGALPVGSNGSVNFTARIKNDAPTGIIIYNKAEIASSGGETVYSNQVQTRVESRGLAGNPPVANAGPDREIFAGESIPLLGSGYDPDGYEVDYRWECTGGNLNSRSIVQPLFTSPSNVSSDTYYTCTLVVTDRENLSDSDQARILVKKKPSRKSYLLEVEKTVRDMSRGDRIWSKTLYASSTDILEFKIEVRAKGEEKVKNLKLKDSLPYPLFYEKHLTINGESYSGDPTKEEIDIGDLYPGETKIIKFRVMVGGEDDFNYGVNKLTNSVVVYNDSLYKTDTCRIIVKKALVKGASTIATGITDNPFFGSLLLPLIIALFLAWAFKSPLIGLDRILAQTEEKVTVYRSEKRLMKKINELKDKLS